MDAEVILIVAALFMLYIGLDHILVLLDTDWPFLQSIKALIVYTGVIVTVTKELLTSPTLRNFFDPPVDQETFSENADDSCEEDENDKVSEDLDGDTKKENDEDEEDDREEDEIAEDTGEKPFDSSAITNLKTQIEEKCMQIKLNHILPILKRSEQNVLLTSDLVEIEEKMRSEDNLKGVSLMLEKLKKRDGWVSSLVNTLKTPEAGSEANYLGKEIEDLQKEMLERIEKKECLLNEAKEQLKKIEKLKGMKQERNALKNRLAELKEIQEKDLKTRQLEKTELEKELADIHKEEERVQSELNEINSEIDGLQRDIDEQNARLGTCEKDVGQLQNIVALSVNEMIDSKKAIGMQRELQLKMEDQLKDLVTDAPYTGPLYDEELKTRIQPIFKVYIYPEMVVNVVHSYDMSVLEEQDIELVQAVNRNRGRTNGAQKLLDLLPRYQGWFQCLIKVLRDPHVDQDHVADAFLAEEKKLLEEQEEQRMISMDLKLEQIILTVWCIRLSLNTRSRESVTFTWSEVDDCIVKFVDISMAEDTHAHSNLAEAIALCPEGFHAFILTSSFQDRVTLRSHTSIRLLENVLGEANFQAYCFAIIIDSKRAVDAQTYTDYVNTLSQDPLTSKCIWYSMDLTNVHCAGAEKDCLKNLFRSIQLQTSEENPFTNFPRPKKTIDIYKENQNIESALRELCLIVNGLKNPAVVESDVLLNRLHKRFETLLSTEEAKSSPTLHDQLVEMNKLVAEEVKVREEEKKQRDQLQKLHEKELINMTLKAGAKKRERCSALGTTSRRLGDSKQSQTDADANSVENQLSHNLDSLETTKKFQQQHKERRIQRIASSSEFSQLTASYQVLKNRHQSTTEAACLGQTELLLRMKDQLKDLWTDAQWNSSSVDWQNESTEREGIDLLLIGISGLGKSSTGNSILRKRAFKTGSDSSRVTLTVQAKLACVYDKTVKVVDSPGLCMTQLNKEEAITDACQNMARAMALCPNGFNALLLVSRFGTRFTAEEQHSIDMLKMVLGPNIIKDHCILIFTDGECFDVLYEDTRFEDWLIEQDGPMKMLINECSYRCVLFRNKAEDPMAKKLQMDQLLIVIASMKSKGKRYTDDLFKSAQMYRDRLLVDAQAPQIRENMQDHLTRITKDLEKVIKNKFGLRDQDRALRELNERVERLQTDVKKRDKGTGILKDIETEILNVALCIKAERTENDKQRNIQEEKTWRENDLRRQREGDSLNRVIIGLFGGLLPTSDTSTKKT